mmetsp:Transcript_38328/g.43500  ORF Transcript_38328/g.43500 Transcript_38328/m.43500 type:complete len:436 (-) Transcript_38328:682-1989(-)
MSAQEIDENLRLKDLDYLLLRESPLANDDFEPGEEIKEVLTTQAKVLVIGAGGLGCELLKNLALSGFRDISVIDMDTIDVTNLNRQFLFRMKDVGRHKSEVAAEFIMKRCPGVKVTPYKDRIQSFDEYFYQDFHIIIAGLDNIDARRWMNAQLHSMVEFDEDGNPDPATLKPFIDGGTEGFKGQARVIIPFMSSCFDCTIGTLPRQHTYPMCTIAETPRLPEHCIQYALVIEWEKAFPGKQLNKDSPEDMKWIFEKAAERAETFKISGVTYMLTMGVVKNIIPAIASTNAIISAACVNEALKVATYCSKVLDNNMMYMGQTGIFGHTFSYEKNEDCLVCSRKPQRKEISKSKTLKELIEELKEDPRFALKGPSVSGSRGILYMPKPPSLEEKHRHKLDMTLKELIEKELMDHNDTLSLTDPVIATELKIILELTE